MHPRTLLVFALLSGLTARAPAQVQAAPATVPAPPRPTTEPSRSTTDHAVVTQAELLRRLIDLDRLAMPPAPGERMRLFSSFDRRSRLDEYGQPVDWEADDDCGHFLRQANGWDVLAEVEGPGAITRIWSGNPQGDIRIVLDGAVVVEAKFEKLLSGSLPPFEAPLVSDGRLSYFPVGFTKNCQVLARGSKSCYQIDTVQFAPGTKVETFRAELDEAAQAALAEVRQALAAGLSDKQLFAGGRAPPVTVRGSIGPDEALAEKIEGAGTVRALYMGVEARGEPDELYALHRCVLRIWCDGADTPQVECPLTDFFGAGFEPTLFRGVPVGTDRAATIPLGYLEDHYMYSLFPMPFRDGVRIEIRNRCQDRRKIGLVLDMRVDRRKPAEDALCFHARFRKEDLCQTFDYAILETTGPGRIVGCSLSVDTPRDAWWGQGDHKIWIDGERFPSYFGTGTADYFGQFGALQAQTGPFCGTSHVAPYGKNSAYRWHIGDCIDFQKSARFTLENYAKDVYYGSVAYWYAPADSTHFFAPLQKDDLEVPGLRIPGAVEAEGNVAGIVGPDGKPTAAEWGAILRQHTVSGAEFSSEQAAYITTAEPVEILIPSREPRTVRLQLRVAPARSFETITIKDAGGKTVGTVQYDRNVADGIYPVGTLVLVKGDTRVRVQCSRPALLDCWVLQDVQSRK
ncbi:MAG: glycoside hydrolase family 172 protein [Planctomycetota bacterium]